MRRSSARAAWVGLGAVGALAVLVFWAFDALPFQDLPAHAGLIAMRHRFTEASFESRFFVLAPHIGPYSLFRFLGEVFVRFVGPLGAVTLTFQHMGDMDGGTERNEHSGHGLQHRVAS